MPSALRKKDPYSKIDKSLPSDARQTLFAAQDAFAKRDYALSARMCQQVLQLVANQPQAANLLCSCLYSLGNLQQAYETAIQLVAIHPNYAQAHNNAAIYAKAMGRLDEAITHFEHALALNYTEANVFIELGHLYLNYANNPVRANQCYLKFLELQPKMDVVWEHICLAGEKAQALDTSPAMLKLLEERLRTPNAYSRAQGVVAISYIVSGLGLMKLLGKFEGMEAGDEALYFDEVFQVLLSDSILQSYIAHHLICDINIEKALTYARRIWLQKTVSDKMEQSIKQHMKCLRAMERQCFRNEYVFFISEEEKAQLELLKGNLESMDADALRSKSGQWSILVYACYSSLRDIKFSISCNDVAKLSGAAVREALRRHVFEHEKELEIGKSIPDFSASEDRVSQEVRDMYEENPYPRWEELQQVSKGSMVNELTYFLKADYHDAVRALPNPPSILVAGCGTGKHALQTHKRFGSKETLAIDLSRASLSYAKRKANEYNEGGITFKRGDILGLGALGKQFDIVESVGVIHHMREPEEGLKQLIKCMKTDGFLKLGLYSELARRSIVKGRELIAEYGYASDEASIRECRQRFMSGEVDREQIWRFLDSTDFYSLSNCRDLLFHVQEHRYTIPQISEMLERNGLEFVGFEGLPEKVRRGFLNEYPNKDDFWSLEKWHTFEGAYPDSFLGMYVFWSRLKR